MGEHIIMLMDVYNTSNSISNRNMQAMGEIEHRLLRVDDFEKEMLHQVVTDFDKNPPEYELIDERFMELYDAEQGHLAILEGDEKDTRTNHKINLKKNEMFATVSMESMKHSDIYNVYAELWSKHRQSELLSLPISFDQTELARKIDNQFESILIKLQRVLEIQTMKNTTV